MSIIKSMSNKLLVTYFHEFRIYESTNFYHEKCLVFFKRSCKVSLFVKLNRNSVSNIFYLNRKIIPFFVKTIHGFIDSEFVKTCHEHVNALKDFFRTCNVLPFSCTHLALWRGKEEGLELWLFIWEERKLDFTKLTSLFQLKGM